MELTQKRTVHSCNTIGLASYKFLKSIFACFIEIPHIFWDVLAFIGDNSTSSAADRKRIVHTFEDLYDERTDDLRDRTQSALKRAQTSLDEKMRETFKSGEAEASEKAPGQIQQYGRKSKPFLLLKNSLMLNWEREGGLHWGTYRATVKRSTW